MCPEPSRSSQISSSPSMQLTSVRATSAGIRERMRTRILLIGEALLRVAGPSLEALDAADAFEMGALGAVGLAHHALKHRGKQDEVTDEGRE